MPKLRHSAPSYRLHKSTGQAVVVLNGRSHYLGKHGTPESREAYDRLIAEWLTAGRTPRPADRGMWPSIGEVLAAYWVHAQEYYRGADRLPTSEVNNIRQALRPLRKLYSSAAADAFDSLALEAVRQEMIEMGWCRTNINRAVGRVKRCFRWAIKRKLAPKDVAFEISLVEGLEAFRSAAKERPKVKGAPSAHIEAVRKLVTPTIRAMIDLQLLTAARPGEIIAMRGADVDRSGTLWVYRPRQHKTSHRGHEREIFLGPKARKIVKQFLPPEADAYLFSPRAAKELHWAERRAARKTKVTPSQADRKRLAAPRRPPGERYSIQSYCRAITKACAKAGVPSWHPHQLRHNAGTTLRAKYGVEVASAILGHRSIKTTEVYAEANMAKAAATVGKIG